MPSVQSKGGNHLSVRDTEDFPSSLGTCHFNLDRNGERADFKVSCTDYGKETFKTSGTTDKSALIKLQEIIDQYNVAKLNGFYKRNSALGNSFSLKVNYESGEKISAGAEGGASTSSDTYLPRREFGVFFRKLVEQSGQKIPGAIPPISTMRRFSLKFTNFHAAPDFPEGRYKLGYNEFGTRRQVYLVYGTDKESIQSIFLQYITKQEADELRALIEKNELMNLSGDTLRKPEQGDHKFEWELGYQDHTLLHADAIGDESIQPAKYWDDNGNSYIIFYKNLMEKYGKPIH